MHTLRTPLVSTRGQAFDIFVDGQPMTAFPGETIAGVLLGAVAGYLYWQQIGCSSGTCMITSKWHNSTAYGALMGGLLFSLFKKEKHADKQ